MFMKIRALSAATALLAAIGVAGCSSSAGSTASDTHTGASSQAATHHSMAAKTPQQTVTDAVCGALGDSNRHAKVRCKVTTTGKAGKPITVRYAGDENLTEGLTKDTMRLEGVKVLKAVRGSAKWAYSAVQLVGTYELQDKLGNSSEDVVYRTTIPRSTVNKINFDGFDFKNLDTIGTKTFIHPAFQY